MASRAVSLCFGPAEADPPSAKTTNTYRALMFRLYSHTPRLLVHVGARARRRRSGSSRRRHGSLHTHTRASSEGPGILQSCLPRDRLSSVRSFALVFASSWLSPRAVPRGILRPRRPFRTRRRASAIEIAMASRTISITVPTIRRTSMASRTPMVARIPTTIAMAFPTTTTPTTAFRTRTAVRIAGAWSSPARRSSSSMRSSWTPGWTHFAQDACVSTRADSR